MKHSLYFVKHTDPEKQIKGSKSVWNQKEIHHILDVAVYLMKKGYPAEDITVLCPYRTQVYFLSVSMEYLCYNHGIYTIT